MRVLTVRQPWAWAIVHGGKDVENRTRSLGPYRGPVAIHAAEKWAPAGATDPLLLGALCATNYDDAPVIEANGYVDEDQDEFRPRGAVLGVVELVDVHRDDTEKCNGPLRLGICSRWAQAGQHHLVLAHPQPFATPIPAKGRLGLRRPDDELLAAIDEQLGMRALAVARGGVS